MADVLEIIDRKIGTPEERDPERHDAAARVALFRKLVFRAREHGVEIELRASGGHSMVIFPDGRYKMGRDGELSRFAESPTTGALFAGLAPKGSLPRANLRQSPEAQILDEALKGNVEILVR